MIVALHCKAHTSIPWSMASDLRQLPYAKGSFGDIEDKAFFRRPFLGRAAFQGHRTEYYAGQGNRHRQLHRAPSLSN